jgi:hypothetical protein
MQIKQTRRNPVARSPLLRKGGAHVKSKTGQRVRARLSTHDAIFEWLDDVERTEEQKDGEQKLPDFFWVAVKFCRYGCFPYSCYNSSFGVRRSKAVMTMNSET